MKLKYALNENVFSSKKAFQDALQSVKEKKFTVNDIILVIDDNVKDLYNRIASHFFGSEPINHDNIYKRETMLAYLKTYEAHNMHLFHILTNNGLIGVCGRGYTLEHVRFPFCSETHNRVIDLIFHAELYV